MSEAGVEERPGANKWLIAVVVSLATFMEVLDTTIANVALRYIAGGLAVSPDESSWVVTTYLVANAVVLCASGWLATTFGRKNFYQVCVALFTVSSILCGFAWNLPSLLFFRVLQGLGGGGMAPVAQSILASTFPPQQRGQAFAVYGIAVVVAPVVGPTLGGWITDNYSWHWCFLINGPVGVASMALVALFLPASPRAKAERQRRWAEGLSFDFVGFGLVAAGLGALEMVLDRGQIEDWFSSNVIVGFALTSATCLALLVPWELTRAQPVIDISLLFRRQFGACFLVMFEIGGILIGTTQIVPQLLQELFGYTATWAGLALSPGGIMTMVMMIVVGRLTSIFPAKYMIAAGAAVVVFAMYVLTSVTLDANFWFFAISRVYIGVGLPLIFISMTNASYAGIPPDKTDQASALINVARNVGGSFGVAISQTVLAQREQFHTARLVEHIVPSDPNYQATLARVTAYFQAQGSSVLDASNQAVGWIAQTIRTQAGLMAYIDVFWVLGLISATAIPLAFLLNSKSASEPPPGAH